MIRNWICTGNKAHRTAQKPVDRPRAIIPRLIPIILTYFWLTGGSIAEVSQKITPDAGSAGSATFVQGKFNPRQADLWLLSGQSNMVGWGLLKDEVQSDPRVWRFDKEGNWVIAEEPLHDLF